MMALEGPVLNSIVSRLPEQRDNLAAFGLAINIAFIVESPIIMMLSASVALVKGRRSFLSLRRYSTWLNWFVTFVMVLTVIPPFYPYLSQNILQLTPHISELLHGSLLSLLLWSASIGYRRFYQGLMIRAGKTKRVAVATTSRLASMALCAILLSNLTKLDGALVGSISLGLGVLLEAIATRIIAQPILKELLANDGVDDTELTVKQINKFYIPLAMTSVIGFAVSPMLSFFMSKFRMMIESLAVYPVIDSFVFQFRSPGFSFQETAIALLGEKNKNVRLIRRFGVWMMIITTSLLCIVAFTPLIDVVYSKFPYQLHPDLASYAILPTQLLVLLPMLSVLYSLQRAVLINSHKTKQVTISTFFEVGFILVVLLILWMTTDLTGSVAVAIALVVGRIVANVYLHVEYKRTLKVVE